MKIKVRTVVLAVMGLLFVQSASAFYNPSTGRWLSRDPIEERGGINLHSAVRNDSINHVDTLGLQFSPTLPYPTPPYPPDVPPPWWPNDDPFPLPPSGPCAEFEQWYKTEKSNLGWMKELPNCPCTIKVSSHCVIGKMKDVYWVQTLDEVSSDKEAGWKLDPPLIVLGSRKGYAANCMRSKPLANGAAQECCYDYEGNLITGGNGAGTVDRGSGLGGHLEADVKPYLLAEKCDKIQGGHSCVLKYLEVRPINNGNKCKTNVR